jgi:DNA-binding transcriptional ArsR family regulator
VINLFVQNANPVYNIRMLEGIFGNKTAEKVLLHIYHYGEIHASAIAEDYEIYKNSVSKQLDRFENAGILISKQVGKSRIYSLNKKSPFHSAITEILRIAYESIPLEERMKLFRVRRRPRRKGKPIR